MPNSLEAAKYIKKLIRIFYDKEKTIEQLKQLGIDDSISSHHKPQPSMVQQQIQQENTSDIYGVKVILKRKNSTEVQIDKLNSEVTGETMREKDIQKLKKEKKDLGRQLNQMMQKYQAEKDRGDHWKSKYEKLYQQNFILQSQNQIIKDKLTQIENLQTKVTNLANSLNDYVKLELKIGQKIDAIYSEYCLNPLKISNRIIEHNETAQRTQDLQVKLDQIELFMKDRNLQQDPDVLNETLEGLSIIMKSFEDKLEQATDRQNINKNKGTGSGVCHRNLIF